MRLATDSSRKSDSSAGSMMSAKTHRPAGSADALLLSPVHSPDLCIFQLLVYSRSLGSIMVFRGIGATRSGAPVLHLLAVVLRVALSLYGFPGVRCHGRPEVCKGPWSLWGSRVYAPHGCMGLMAGYAACCTQYIRHFPLVPVQVRSMELPATAVGEWWRHHSL